MTADSNQISSADFIEQYSSTIRVGLNWERFHAEGWPVERVILDEPAALSRCFMPWFIGKDGTEVAYDFAVATPMRLTDVPKAMVILNTDRQADILRYVDEFRDRVGVVEFTVPTYALPDDCYFVLDGNHRLSALSINPVPFKVVLWNIRGPLDPDCLLDLRHWQARE